MIGTIPSLAVFTWDDGFYLGLLMSGYVLGTASGFLLWHFNIITRERCAKFNFFWCLLLYLVVGFIRYNSLFGVQCFILMSFCDSGPYGIETIFNYLSLPGVFQLFVTLTPLRFR